MAHAPHCEVSQPMCVPVRLRCSLIKVDSKVLALISALTSFPFIVKDISIQLPLMVNFITVTLKKLNYS